MNTDRNVEDLERRLARSLHAAAPRPAPDLADRLLRRTAVIEQRHGFLGLGFFPALAAAAVVVVAVVIGLAVGNILPRGTNVGPSTMATTPEPSRSPSSAAPSATALASPMIEPSPLASVFEGGQRCTNPELGYTVDYPANWWANEAQEFDDPVLTDIVQCFAFSDEPAEILPNSELPPGIAIVAGLADLPLGNPEQPILVLGSRETTVDSRPATVEEIEWTEDTVFQRAGDRSYRYRIALPSGETLQFSTATDELTSIDEYEAHKQILDRVMETLQLSDDQAG